MFVKNKIMIYLILFTPITFYFILYFTDKEKTTIRDFIKYGLLMLIPFISHFLMIGIIILMMISEHRIILNIYKKINKFLDRKI